MAGVALGRLNQRPQEPSPARRGSIDGGAVGVDNNGKTIAYSDRPKKDTMPPRRKSRTVTISLPPEMFEEVRRVKDEEGRDMSELVREALRLYMEDRELRRQQRLERLRARQANQS